MRLKTAVNPKPPKGAIHLRWAEPLGDKAEVYVAVAKDRSLNCNVKRARSLKVYKALQHLTLMINSKYIGRLRSLGWGGS